MRVLRSGCLPFAVTGCKQLPTAARDHATGKERDAVKKRLDTPIAIHTERAPVRISDSSNIARRAPHSHHLPNKSLRPPHKPHSQEQPTKPPTGHHQPNPSRPAKPPHHRSREPQPTQRTTQTRHLAFISPKTAGKGPESCLWDLVLHRGELKRPLPKLVSRCWTPSLLTDPNEGVWGAVLISGRCCPLS
jgi:hypothetical protein